MAPAPIPVTCTGVNVNPGKQYGNNESNWWVPTLYCVLGLLRAAGLDDVTGWKLTREPPRIVDQCRGFAQGRRKPAVQ